MEMNPGEARKTTGKNKRGFSWKDQCNSQTLRIDRLKRWGDSGLLKSAVSGGVLGLSHASFFCVRGWMVLAGHLDPEASRRVDLSCGVME